MELPLRLTQSEALSMVISELELERIGPVTGMGKFKRGLRELNLPLIDRSPRRSTADLMGTLDDWCDPCGDPPISSFAVYFEEKDASEPDEERKDEREYGAALSPRELVREVR